MTKRFKTIGGDPPSDDVIAEKARLEELAHVATGGIWRRPPDNMTGLERKLLTLLATTPCTTVEAAQALGWSTPRYVKNAIQRLAYAGLIWPNEERKWTAGEKKHVFK